MAKIKYYLNHSHFWLNKQVFFGATFG